MMSARELRERKEILKKRAVIGLIFMNLFLIGAFCNLLVISENGGKMPVYTNTTFETSPRHFIFNESSQVKLFLLTDILHVAFVDRGFEVFFSIGDVIIYATGITFFFYCVALIIMDVKYLVLKFRSERKKKCKR